jgi:flagellar basal-body rod protein FlgC
VFSLRNIASSGLNSASYRLAVTAHNIANMSTEGYKSVRTTSASVLPAGVRPDTVTVDPSQGPIDGDGVEMSNVDPVRDTVNLIRDKNLYSANAKMLKVGDQMMGTLLDIMG